MNKQVVPISLLIPTMDRPNSLNSTLLSFFSLRNIPSELIVVDQSKNLENSKKNEEIVNNLNTICKTKYIFQPTPSLTKARNNAINAATFDIVVCSDDDVEAISDIFADVYTIMVDDSVSMVGATDLNTKANNSLLGYICGTKSIIKRKKGHVTKSILGRYPNKIKGSIETEWVMGFFFSIKKSNAMQWNVLWDEKLTGYAYAEDLDFSYRYYLMSKKMRKKCLLNDKICVKHNVSQESRISSDSHLLRYVANRYYLFYKFKFKKIFILFFKWTNFWMKVFYIMKKNNYLGLKKAIKKTKMFKKEIIKGEFGNVYE